VVSISATVAETVAAAELPVRLRFEGRSGDAEASGLVEEVMKSEAVTLGMRVVLRTESSSVDSRCTRACILSSLRSS
jgi:hypothetical protein